jgi:hydroxymethylpyrimidine/phosphomethylpyrimidine kinase
MPSVAMTIAGSDSGAGAGLQADLKTFGALGVFGTSVVTAVTAQNTAEVLGVVTLDPQMVDLQITAVLSDLEVAAVKTGMLANAEIVAAVARHAAAGDLPNLVVDPVLVTTTGQRLLDEAAVGTYLDLLIPHALLVTPNVREAAVLVGRPAEDLTNVEQMTEAARLLLDRGARNVLVKGGHLQDELSSDVLMGSDVIKPRLIDGTDGRGHGADKAIRTATDDQVVLSSPRVRTANDHGTGCTLSAAIVAHLAARSPLPEAVWAAKRYVSQAISGAAAWHLGRGHGPLDHFGWAFAEAGREPATTPICDPATTHLH